MDSYEHPSAATSSDLPSWMRQALSAFEADSIAACRALRVSMAVKVFGVGILLPNDLEAVPGNARETRPRAGCNLAVGFSLAPYYPHPTSV